MKASSAKFWYAQFNLAIHFVLNLARRLFFWKYFGEGVEQFTAHFGREGIFPISPEERIEQLHFSRFIGGGLCSIAHPALPLLAKTFVRAIDRASVVKTAVFSMSEEACREGETLCPRRVPLVLMRNAIVRRVGKNEPKEGVI